MDIISFAYYAVTVLHINHINHCTKSLLEFIHATAREFIATRLQAVDTEQLVESQQTKIVRLVATFDPSWPLLLESWPKLQTEQLKIANLSPVSGLFSDLKVPMFNKILHHAINSGHFYQDGTDSTQVQNAVSMILAARIHFALLLSAAVQADCNTLCAILGGIETAWLQYEICFGASSMQQDNFPHPYSQ